MSFKNIVAGMAMFCALLVGAQSAWAQALVGIEKTHRASENIGTLWETCVRLFTLEKATAKCWMNTLRLKADGSLERVDPTNVKAGEILYFGIPTPVLKEEAQKTLGGAQVHSNTVGTTDNAKAGVVPAPAKPQASQDTALEAMKPQSNVLPETNALAPLAAPSAPTLTEDLVFKTPEQINPETGISVPVISGATEASSTDKFLENFFRTTLFSVILILAIISMFVGAEYRNDLEYFSKLSSTSRKTTLKVVDPKDELMKRTARFLAEGVQTPKAMKPKTDRFAVAKRLTASGTQAVKGFGQKAVSFFARPGVKTQQGEKKSKWSKPPKPEGPKMTSPMPEEKSVPKRQLFATQSTTRTSPEQFAEANKPWDPDVPAVEKPETQSPIFADHDWMSRGNAAKGRPVSAPEPIPGARVTKSPASTVVQLRPKGAKIGGTSTRSVVAKVMPKVSGSIKRTLTMRGQLLKDGADQDFELLFRRGGSLGRTIEWFNPVMEKWEQYTPRVVGRYILDSETAGTLGLIFDKFELIQFRGPPEGALVHGQRYPSIEELDQELPELMVG